jgi:hypothetical protein
MRGQQIVNSVTQPKAVNKCVLAFVCMLLTVTGSTWQQAVRGGKGSPVSQQLLQWLDFFLSCEEHQDVACLLFQVDL